MTKAVGKVKLLPKNKEVRTSEVEKIMEQFTELGLPLEHEGVQQFIKISRDFEENGVSASGFIKLNGFKRILEYKYSMRPYITSSIVLRNAPHI
jgi:hypothetical protein